MDRLTQRQLGIFLIAASVAGFGYAAWKSVVAPPLPGDIPAIALILLMIGMSFYFPDLLKGADAEHTSSMRLSLLMIICVFCLVSVKAGWNAKDMSGLVIPESWAWVLAVAIGGKAAQFWGEMKNVQKSDPAVQAPPFTQTVPSGANPLTQHQPASGPAK